MRQSKAAGTRASARVPSKAPTASSSATLHDGWPIVGIAVDGVTSYGRQIMRGAMRYANARRRWLIHEELRHTSSLPGPWPQCAGTIIGGMTAQMFEQIRARSDFLVQCTGSPQPGEFPCVCLDDHAAGRMAAAHLLDCHLEHFGYFGWRQYATSMNRVAGFCEQLAERGFTCSTCDIRPAEAASVDRSYRPELIDWLRGLPKPVGIMTVDDTAARELAAACLAANLAVPDRVAIVGVNNDDLLCESAWPPLSSVEADFSRVGYLAAQTLDRLMSGERIPPGERLVRLQPLRVVGRVSTDVLAVDDPSLADAIRHIRVHACDPCTVQDVLRHVPVGRRWLERQFFAKLGRSPHDEIIRVRMDVARRLLTHESCGLAEVARRCGFSAVTSFTRAFSQSQGAPPATFRRANRQAG